MKSNSFLLAVITLSGFFAYMLDTCITPFLPAQIASRDAPPIHNGIIVALISVGGFFIPALMNFFIIPRLGLPKSLLLGILVIAFSILGFGFAYYLPGRALFLTSLYINRIFQGIGGSIIFHAAYAMLTDTFRDNLTCATATLNLGNNIGLSGGPLMGGYFYSLFGYVGPFIIFGGMALVFALVIAFGKFQDSHPRSKKQNEILNDQKKVTLCRILSNVEALMGYMQFVLAISSMIFMQPILANQLKLLFNFTPDRVAYFFGFYSVSSLLINVSLTLMPKFNRLWILLAVGCCVAALGSFLLGPSRLFHFPQSQGIMIAGLILLGIGSQILLNLSTPLTIRPLLAAHPGQQANVSKIFAGIRITMASFAFLITPFFSSLTTQIWSFAATCDSMGLVLSSFAVVYVAYMLTRPRGKQPEREPLLN